MNYKNKGHIEQFVVIDDVGITLFLCKAIIQKTLENVPVISFKEAALAIDYFENYFGIRPIETIVLLDINMPQFSGWEVLDHLAALDAGVRDKMTIFMLTSSINPQDKQLAKNHPLVNGFLEKPITSSSLVYLLERTEKNTAI